MMHRLLERQIRELLAGDSTSVPTSFLQAIDSSYQQADEELQTLRRSMELTSRDEERLRQAQRMEAVGRLAGGIAHDFNNLLTVIKGYCDLCQGRPEGRPLERQLSQIQRAAQQASDLTGQLLAYSRQQILEPQVLDLHQTISALEPMLERLIGEHIDLQSELHACPSTVLADEGRIQQVVMNLVINARDALPEGGRIVLQTDNGQVDDRHVDPHKTEISDRPMVLLRVQDDGHGIDPELQNKIFEPFVTTKAVGAGTGLGLATVYGIVKQSQGYIWVESDLGRGTEFTIALPTISPTSSKNGEDLDGSAAPRARQRSRVLLVEDDPLVRVVLEEVLALEHDLEVAESPEQALECLDRGTEIDLLVTDIVMPGMSGFDLAEKITLSHPSTQVLYISGYNPDAYKDQGILQPGANFLAKPFNSTQLLDKVREVLADQAVEA